MMISKTVIIGGIRTSVKLEQEFWFYLKKIADNRNIRLSRLINDIADAHPDRTNLASTIRVFALVHAQLQAWNRERYVPS